MSSKQSRRSPSKNNKKNADILTLPDFQRQLVNWLKRQGECSLEKIAERFQQDRADIRSILDELKQKGFVQQKVVVGELHYQTCLDNNTDSASIWQTLEAKLGKVTISTLIILTFLTVALLTPFAFSKLYLALLRDRVFEWHQFLHTDIYKQITGYLALFFVFLEMVLTLRKRGRQWKISLPGSMQLWRGLHIFTGVTLLGMILIHTAGATGNNFNAAFLWVFFGVTLSALVGVTTETGILESPRKYFGSPPENATGIAKFLPSFSKGYLIRKLRMIWLSTHILLVSVFFVMLGFHIFLAYYYQ